VRDRHDRRAVQGKKNEAAGRITEKEQQGWRGTGGEFKIKYRRRCKSDPKGL